MVKTVLNSFCLTSNLRAECEVYGLFRDLIPVAALGEEEVLQRGRGRQGLLPDFRLEIPSPAGEPEYQLAELKIIGAVERWYPRSGGLARRNRGVERRVVPLPAEYSNPLAKLDRKYHGTPLGQVDLSREDYKAMADFSALSWVLSRSAAKTSMPSWKPWQTASCGLGG